MMYTFLRYCCYSFPPLESWPWNRTESDHSAQAPSFQPAPLRPARPPTRPCCRFQARDWLVEGLCCWNWTPRRRWGRESSWRSWESPCTRTVSEHGGHKWLYPGVCMLYWQPIVIFPASFCCSHAAACAHSHLYHRCTRPPAACHADIDIQ